MKNCHYSVGMREFTFCVFVNVSADSMDVSVRLFFSLDCSFNDKTLGANTMCFCTGVLHTQLMRTFRNPITSLSSSIRKCFSWRKVYWLNWVWETKNIPCHSWVDLIYQQGLDIAKTLVWHSKLGLSVLLLDINNLKEHQHQTKALWNYYEWWQRLETNHEQCSSHKSDQSPL